MKSGDSESEDENPVSEAEEELSEDEQEQSSNTGDNFSQHFFTNFEASDIEKLKTGSRVSNTFSWPNFGSFVESKPEEEKFHLIQLNKPFKCLDQLQLKPMLKENIAKTMLTISGNASLSSFQLQLLGLLTSYKDLYFNQRNFQNEDEICVAYSAHALNHVLKTRSRVISHNAKVSQHQIQKEEYRDQGLTRPKVMIIVPFKSSALRIVNCMVSLLFGDAKDMGEKKMNLMNYKRFKKEFSPAEDEPPISGRKPEDYKKIFAGNIEDSFRIGLAITKKSFKLYSDFYSSDIIIASPLGLRLILGADGDEKRDYDFLSSIEIAIFDQMDIFLMQNWEHILLIMKNLHLKPKDSHGVDFSRVKLWILELWNRFYYQLLVFTSVSSSLITGFFNRHSGNFSGKLLLRNEVKRNKAAINQVFIQCPQFFHRFECGTFANNSDSRFDFFVKKILPKFNDPLMVRTMIFVPSYLDFVRLRNYFRNEDLGFSQICEYTEQGKVAKARHIFFYGGRHFLLFTERFHFFNRYTIKGIRHLIFYEPPLYSHFYSEMVNSMHLSNQGKKLATDYGSMSVTVLFNRYDVHSLIPLVGSATAQSLLQSESEVHMFLTESQ